MGISLWQLLVLVLVIALVAGFAFRASRMGVRSSDEDDVDR
jgi:Sec-independent protein translocase protein TatA